MKKLFIKFLASNLLVTSLGTTISCEKKQVENLNYDLATIDEKVFSNYHWTVDQMLGSELRNFQTLNSTILKIIQNNFLSLNILKINIDIYYGTQTTANDDYLIDFSSIKNLMPITNFSVHITPNIYGSYINDRWITINKKLDLSKLPIFQTNAIFFADNPVPMTTDKLINTFMENINKLLQTEEGYNQIVTFFKEKNMWNDSNPLPKGIFSLESNNKIDNSGYLNFDASTATLVFNPAITNSNYKIILDSKGFAFQTETNFLSVWNVTIAGDDFNANDWRNIDWKPVTNKTYDGTTTIQEVITDVKQYLVAWSAHVHNSHFMTENDVEIILKKGYKPDPNDAWPLTTQLKDLWKSPVEHGSLPYVYAWFHISNKEYIKIDNVSSSAGTHVCFNIK